MFCNQCQEAFKVTGCEVVGMCGKKESTANLQDLLILACQKLATKIKSNEIEPSKRDYAIKFIEKSLFTTITNANFNDADLEMRIREALSLANELHIPNNLLEDYSIIFKRHANEDIQSLRELTLYGLKGMCAYLKHAQELGFDSEEAKDFIVEALVKTATLEDADQLTALALETGKYSVLAMETLDRANTTTYGNPEITEVNIGVGSRPGILVSGHDLKDLEELLEQSKDAGIDIYTHSEMLPAHYYPALKKYPHLFGNYGNAWWKQNKEFESFNGPILMTTNCITPVRSSYSGRIFTTGVVSYEGIKHISDRVNGTKDFSEIIELAKKCKAPTQIEEGKIVGGFAHNQVLSLADKVIEAIKTGAIKRFVVMAGCDGRQKERSYYTELASELPKDHVILTAGCAKYRYNKLELGDIGGIPRILDAGQCNDSYSLAKIALTLKDVFELEDINDLPISFDIAWYEQKAVAVLLALLHLGVKNIKLGPTLPAFLSPNVANVLIDAFGINGVESLEQSLEDLKRA